MGRSIKLSRGQELVHQGDAAERVYMVCAGHLKLYASSVDGRVLLLRMAAPGDVVGLAPALRNTHQKLTAEALDECELKSVGRDEFLEFAEKYREAGRNVASAAAKEYETAFISAQRLALAGSAQAKLASLLIELAGLNPANNSGSGIKIPMPLTHEELGNMCGLSRETVTRQLSRFHADGILEQGDGCILLQKPASLERMFR